MGEDNKFFGIVSFCRDDVRIVKNELKYSPIDADIVYAPMHNDEYADTTIDLYVGDSHVDLPDHAELRYRSCLNLFQRW